MSSPEPSGDAIGEKLITAIRNQWVRGKILSVWVAGNGSVGFKADFPSRN